MYFYVFVSSRQRTHAGPRFSDAIVAAPRAFKLGLLNTIGEPGWYARLIIVTRRRRDGSGGREGRGGRAPRTSTQKQFKLVTRKCVPRPQPGTDVASHNRKHIFNEQRRPRGGIHRQNGWVARRFSFEFSPKTTRRVENGKHFAAY